MADGTIRSVGVIGTGIMGAAMARNLAAAGLEVRAWDRTPQALEGLAGAGVTLASSAAAAVSAADAALTMVTDGPAVEEVLESDVLATLARGRDAVLLQMSTIGAAWAKRVGELAAAHAVSYVDAPVVGTRGPAEAGELVVLASGPEEALGRCEPVFGAVGRKTFWLGAPPAGSALKLVANCWIVGLVGLCSETIALAEATGVEPEDFLAVIAGGPLDNGYAQIKGRAMTARSYEPSFYLRNALKDADLVRSGAEAAGLGLPVTEAIAAQLARAVDRGHGEDDMAALVEALRS